MMFSFFRSRRGAALALVLALAVAGCAKSEERSEAAYQRALKLIADGKDVPARLELLDALKYSSDRVDAWRALAGVDERTGERKGYLRDLRRIIDLDPSDTGAKVRLARLMLSAGVPEAALGVIDPIASQDDASADAIGTRAAILAATRDNAAALREARRAVDRDPSNLDGLIILALDAIARNKPDDALALLDRAPPVTARDTRAASARIRALDRKGDLAGVEKELRNLIGLVKDNNALRGQLVQVLARQGKTDQAEKELRSLADSNEKDSRYGLDLVRFVIVARGVDAGRTELQARIAKGGDVFPYQMALVDLEAASQNLPAATALLDKLVTTDNPTNKAAATVRLAELKAGQKDLAGAEALVEQVLATDRRNVGALRLRGVMRLERGETDAAIASFREALNEQPKSADLLQWLAQAYERGRQTELADRQYSEAVRAADYNPAVVLRYAAFLQRTANAARAEDVLLESARRNPQNVDIASSLAQVRLSRGNYAGALEIADAMARNDQTKALGEQIRAAAANAQNKPDEGLAALERAHAADPTSLSAASALIRSHLARRDYDKAQKVVDDMLQKGASVPLLLLKGQVQAERGASDEAAKSFEAAIAQNEKDVGGYIALAELQARQRNFDAAVATIDRGLAATGNPINLSLVKVGLLDQMGAYDRAIAEAERLYKDEPGSLAALNNLVSLTLDHRTDKASVDRALSLADNLKGSRVPYFMDTYGWALYQRGDAAGARDLLEQAKAQLPNAANVRYHLGMAYRAAGDAAKASDELNAALALETGDTDLRKKIQAAINARS